MKIFYTDHFHLPLPSGHRFPMSKYRRLRKRIVDDETLRDDVLLVPSAANDDQLLTCHDADYVERVKTGTLDAAEVRRIGFPWSPRMPERSRRSVGATIAAARAALDGDGVSVNLAGGTHHAMTNAGEGYCVFNDAAVAIRSLRHEGRLNRAAVVDLDVHQGNGTAQIAASDPDIFTLSIHGERNFPLRKFPSDLDVALPDGTSDADYLSALRNALSVLDRSGRWDLVIFLAGADPLAEDRLGRLSLSKNGLSQRDEHVLRWCFERQIPLAIAMAGGYAPRIDDIVDVHHQTVRIASRWAESG